MADSSNIDAALVAKLSGDTTLMSLMTDGVYMDVAPNTATKFVVISLVMAEDAYVFEGIAYETCQYLIKAVEKSTSGATVKTAAARIQTLLQDVPLTITGYSHMLTRRAERIRYAEVDQADGDARWQHRGGRYDVVVSPSA